MGVGGETSAGRRVKSNHCNNVNNICSTPPHAAPHTPPRTQPTHQPIPHAQPTPHLQWRQPRLRPLRHHRARLAPRHPHQVRQPADRQGQPAAQAAQEPGVIVQDQAGQDKVPTHCTKASVVAQPEPCAGGGTCGGRGGAGRWEWAMVWVRGNLSRVGGMCGVGRSCCGWLERNPS